MASFPALFHGSVALYPLTAAVRQTVGIHQFTDFTEQRFVEMPPLRRFVLVLEDISASDRDAIEAFFESVKGGFDSTWDITIGGTTHEHMVFETDVLADREADAELHTLTLPCRQVRS